MGVFIWRRASPLGRARPSKRAGFHLLFRFGISGGGTATRLALKTVEDQVLNFRRKGSTVALFLLTDGDSNVGGNPNKVAKRLRDKHIHNVEIYVVGIGKKVKHKSLRQLASRGEKEHIFAVKDFRALRKVKKWIVKYPSIGKKLIKRNITY